MTKDAAEISTQSVLRSMSEKIDDLMNDESSSELKILTAIAAVESPERSNTINMQCFKLMQDNLSGDADAMKDASTYDPLVQCLTALTLFQAGKPSMADSLLRAVSDGADQQAGALARSLLANHSQGAGSLDV